MTRSRHKWLKMTGRTPFYDPKLGYRNDPEYRRQRKEILHKNGPTKTALAAADALEFRWAARWQRKLTMQQFVEKPHA